MADIRNPLRREGGEDLLLDRVLKVAAYTIFLLALTAGPAFAYREALGSMDPSSTALSACPQCHGIEPGETSPTVGTRVVPSNWTWDTEAGLNVGSRKGPHGAYTAGTQKCQICHSMHAGPNLQDGPALLAETIAATCLTCHDGTGGGGVYGVIAQRTATDPTDPGGTLTLNTIGGGHRIGYLNGNSAVVVPGGMSTGFSIETTFSGSSGALTCSDCHNPHNSRTVQPFVGDRKRSSAEASGSAALASNRLLRIKPTTADSTVTVYGTGWCASCHKGSHTTGSPGLNHSIETNDALRNYSSVIRLTGLNTSATSGTPGTLGGNNFGYIMPDTNGPDPGEHGGELPICQQCHEDSREVGTTYGAADQFSVVTTQTFDAPLDGDVAGNPQFQNFPHESVNDGLLVETDDGLCANCHHF